MASIILYKNTSDNKVINKNLENETLKNMIIKNECNVIEPIFEIDYFNEFSEFNYLYSDTFKRYYYINNLRIIKGNKLELSCKVDVLMSFKNQFINTEMLINRNSNYRDSEITDKEIVLSNKNNILVKKIESDIFLNTYSENYILQINGR